MKKHLKFLFIISCSLIISKVSAQVKSGQLNLSNGLALQGYDPVSYFTNGIPTKGKKSISAQSDEANYYFSSSKNKELFVKNPNKYRPQYGGWCAYAMGQSGEKVEIDPESFKILDGKLYVFYKSWINNTHDKWEKNEVQLKKQADNNWKKYIQ